MSTAVFSIFFCHLPCFRFQMPWNICTGYIQVAILQYCLSPGPCMFNCQVSARQSSTFALKGWALTGPDPPAMCVLSFSSLNVAMQSSNSAWLANTLASRPLLAFSHVCYELGSSLLCCQMCRMGDRSNRLAPETPRCNLASYAVISWKLTGTLGTPRLLCD